MSKVTAWPSSKVLNPSSSIAEKCTNTSSPPSRSMKPKPFSALNHFTVPCSMLKSSSCLLHIYLHLLLKAPIRKYITYSFLVSNNMQIIVYHVLFKKQVFFKNSFSFYTLFILISRFSHAIRQIIIPQYLHLLLH